ncbi:hypothetical protein [Siphonobacter sp.]
MSKNEDRESLPPFIRSWQQLYALVIANLILMIGLFWWFTEAFS